MIKKTLVVLFVICMAFSSFTATASVTATSGICGDNLTWNFEEKTCTLTISGTGTMFDYVCTDFTEMYTNAPWNDYYGLIKNIIIEEGTTYIGTRAFSNCTSLTNIEFPKSLTAIGDNAFMNCCNLPNINLPLVISSIGGCAFADCTKLTSLTLPESIETIGRFAFCDCSNLSNIIIPDKEISFGYRAFFGTQYYNNSNNWKNGVFHIGNSLIEANASTGGIYNIKKGTKYIANYAFEGCENLIGITIPNSVIYIGEDAFGLCEKFKDVYYPGTEDEWKKIHIDEYNENLKDAIINFNIDINHPGVMSSMPINQDGNRLTKDNLKTLSEISFSVENQISSNEAKVFFVAFYDINNKVLFAGKKEIVFDSKTEIIQFKVTEDVSDSVKMRVFGLDGFKNLKPIMKTAEEIKFA